MIYRFVIALLALLCSLLNVSGQEKACIDEFLQVREANRKSKSYVVEGSIYAYYAPDYTTPIDKQRYVFVRSNDGYCYSIGPVEIIVSENSKVTIHHEEKTISYATVDNVELAIVSAEKQFSKFLLDVSSSNASSYNFKCETRSENRSLLTIETTKAAVGKKIQVFYNKTANDISRIIIDDAEPGTGKQFRIDSRLNMRKGKDAVASRIKTWRHVFVSKNGKWLLNKQFQNYRLVSNS